MVTHTDTRWLIAEIKFVALFSYTILNMPIRQIDFGSSEYKQMIHLRTEILRKPLHLTFEADELDNEINDILIGAFDEEKILGCCILTPIDIRVVRLRQMAVQNNLQGQRHWRFHDEFC